MSNNTTVETLQARIELANETKKNFSGNGIDAASFDLQHFGQYVIVSDGGDVWLAETSDYEDAVEAVVSGICEGQISRGPDWCGTTPYQELCDLADCIYSRTGTPDDISRLEDLELGKNELADLIASLGATDDWAAHVDLFGDRINAKT